ncbi:MAG: glutamate-5-semialdehyde dehydrogenase [Clostridia bacterium]
MGKLIDSGIALKKSSKILSTLSTLEKNNALKEIIKALEANKPSILAENEKDVQNARDNGVKESLIDRLALNESRLDAIIDSINTVIKLPDPIGACKYGKTAENGMQINQVTVPLGVISIIYESRPNVTVDAAVLALKSGNCVLLRGSSSAINSNKALVKAIREGLSNSKIPADACILVEDTDRALVLELLKMNKYLDLVIPRGGADLINFVVQNATVPTIETGVGNCHLFVDESADFEMALNIIENGKVQRPSVCNALETVLVHKNIAEQFLPKLAKKIGDKVEFYGCEVTQKYIDCKSATTVEYATEFLDYVLAIRVVDDVHQAIEHIDEYTSHHSECIVSNDYANTNIFTKQVDAACVYVNASTRFTDGGEFGFGCEMGISTQKMHVRGPVGLEHLVSSKYVILGNGQIRG